RRVATGDRGRSARAPQGVVANEPHGGVTRPERDTRLSGRSGSPPYVGGATRLGTTAVCISLFSFASVAPSVPVTSAAATSATASVVTATRRASTLREDRRCAPTRVPCGPRLSTTH